MDEQHAVVVFAAVAVAMGAEPSATNPAAAVGVVSNIKVLTEKVAGRLEPRGVEKIVHQGWDER